MRRSDDRVQARRSNADRCDDDELEEKLKSEIVAAEDPRLQDLRTELSELRRLIASTRAMPVSPDGEQQRQSGRKKLANRHSRTNTERRAKRKVKAEQRRPTVIPRVRTERQKKIAAKKHPQTFDAADLPGGWHTGKLDDGTPFWFHEDRPKDIVFTFPSTGSDIAKNGQGATVSPPSRKSADAVVMEATEVLLCHFERHQPTKANREAVAEVILEYQLQRYE